MGDERRRSAATGALGALQPAGMCAGTRLAAVRDGAMLRLLAGGTGAAIRPQHELGITTSGTGGSTAGSDSTAGAGRQDRGTNSDEVAPIAAPVDETPVACARASVCPQSLLVFSVDPGSVPETLPESATYARNWSFAARSSSPLTIPMKSAPSAPNWSFAPSQGT